MKILITGGAGFLGRHTVQKLLDAGHEVTSFSRQKHPWPTVRSIQGDLSNYQQVHDACQGMDAVFHMASKVGMWGKWSDFYRTNVLGTMHIIEACKHHNVSRLIYTSSPSTVFGNEDLNNVDESYPYPKRYYSMYAKSKAMAEQLVLAANSTNLLTVALRPHLILGKDDPHLVAKLIAKHSRLRIVGSGKNLVDVIHVDNAAQAHLLALNGLKSNSPICGKAYFLGQGPIALWPLINRIFNHYNLPPLKRKVPYPLVYMVGATCEFIFKILRLYHVEPPMTRFVAMQFAKNHYFNHAKSKDELGFIPAISLEDLVSTL